MPQVAITMPQLGESIAEATIVKFLVAPGDTVEVDQEIIEVETNKATMAVTTLCGGTVTTFHGEEGVSYAVGTQLGIIEATDAEIDATGVSPIGSDASSQAQTPDTTDGDDEQQLISQTLSHGDNPAIQKQSQQDIPDAIAIEPNVHGLPVPVGTKGANYLSPRMRARMDELGLHAADISAIQGNGAGGRVTIEDLEAFLTSIEDWPKSKASPMRLAVADAMRRSWTRPLATVGMPVVLDKVLAHRKQQSPKPGLTLYILRAFALALKEDPTSAGYLIGENIVHPRAFDIGVAVQVDDGVVVPVIRNAGAKTVPQLSAEYAELVDKARERKLGKETFEKGIATVTNFGTFGLVSGTPIPLPNETLILGLGAGVKKPVWSDEAGAFIPVMTSELVITFDHRVVDGGGAGMLLQKIRDFLQQPEKL